MKCAAATVRTLRYGRIRGVLKTVCRDKDQKVFLN